MSKTYGEQFNEALACKTREEADSWLANEIRCHVESFGQTPEEAEKTIRTNIGYMAGYYGEAEQKKMLELFDAPHPIFGTARPTVQQAFDAGMKAADHNALALTNSKRDSG